MNNLSGHALGPDSANSSNGARTPDLVVNGDLHDHKSGPSASPSAHSPATPTSTFAAQDVGIDIAYQEQESDVRHEPIPVKVETTEKPHVVPSISLNDCMTSRSTSPSHLRVEDLKVEEELATSPVIDSTAEPKDDVLMHDTPTETSFMSSEPIVADTPMLDNDDDDDEHDKPPPAKRPRMESDADPVSFAHSATPPPSSKNSSSTSTPVVPPCSTSTFTAAQHKFCLSMIRSLKKQKDAAPFLKPVDYVLLNVPHYPSVIKTPMDFSTIERKLVSSNPTKMDTNLSNLRYCSVDELISDVRLIFQNCITFNGPEHAISLMGKRVEVIFDKQLKQMPPLEIKPPVVKKVTTPPAPAPAPARAPSPVPQPLQSAVPAKKLAPGARRLSTSVPIIRRSDTEAIGRPKREIHPPPPKDLAYVDPPKKNRKHKVVKDDGTTDQLKFCGKLLADLNRKQHYPIASPFYEPVDWVKLDLPSYPKIVKKPMDLSTMRKKLESNQYPTAQKFFDDFKLMIRNCFLFNPAGTPVNQAGIELQRVFDDKWKHLPPLREVVSEEEEVDGYDTEEERLRTIAVMESQIETMRGNIAALKNNKGHREKKKEKRDKLSVTGNSKSNGKQSKAVSKKKKKSTNVDNDILTFEQKKELSESIQRLDELRLEKVIHIIHEGVPELRDHKEEIELEVDTLPAPVLSRLYNYVIRPMRPPTTKRNRQGKGTGTGGLKRKSMDENAEAEKIRLLEERMALFDPKVNGNTIAAARQDSEHSSDSSSNSDSSGSDSE